MSSEVFRWIIFHVLIAFLLLLDLGFLHRKGKEPKPEKAALWTFFWIAISLGFNLFVYFHYGEEKALAFFTGYLVEKSLSIDNLFVFLLIFAYFKISPKEQYKILYKGIIVAIVLRLGLILGGVSLLQRFHGMIYVLGAFLGYTGLRLIFQKKELLSPENSQIVASIKSWFPKISRTLLALVMIELADILFALDSVPAIFAITVDPYIVYTSNVFAMLGLRSLYFVLARLYDRFHYLKFGLGAILVFMGIKMVIIPVYTMPIALALEVVVAILLIAILVSFSKKVA
jgi:tellurite resistance protein TerC